MDRRSFIALSIAATVDRAAAMERGKTVAIVLSDGNRQGAPLKAGIERGLAAQGLIPDQNLRIVSSWVEGPGASLQRAVADAEASGAAVVVVAGDPDLLTAARTMKLGVPLVYCVGIEPQIVGLEDQTSRQSQTNVVEVTNIALARPMFELLTEALPSRNAVGLLMNPGCRDFDLWVEQFRRVALTNSRRLHVEECFAEADLQTGFANLARAGVSGLIVCSDDMFFKRREDIIGLAARFSLPTIYAQREFVEAGGFMAFGANIADAYRLAGGYAGRLINREHVEVPSHIHKNVELVVNLATARNLGVDLPDRILKRATPDEPKPAR
jgi:ABC-type uncharacterized transport system substrate-binding protein